MTPATSIPPLIAHFNSFFDREYQTLHYVRKLAGTVKPWPQVVMRLFHTVEYLIQNVSKTEVLIFCKMLCSGKYECQMHIFVISKKTGILLEHAQTFFPRVTYICLSLLCVPTFLFLVQSLSHVASLVNFFCIIQGINYISFYKDLGSSTTNWRSDNLSASLYNILIFSLTIRNNYFNSHSVYCVVIRI